MSKTYIASTLIRKARPRSEKLLGTTAVIANGPARETSVLTATQLKLLKDLADWFGYDEDTHSVYVKKDAQGFPRNFYVFGDIAGNGIAAQSQGGSADVQWTQLYPSTGQKIATITINGVATHVYAPVGGSGGTSNYNDLSNRPRIAGHTLEGDMSLATLGIAAANHTHSEYLTTSSAASKYLTQLAASQTYQAKITSTSKLSYSLISDTPDLSKYQAKITSTNKLDYSLISGTPDLSLYQTKITSTNKLGYSLISGTPNLSLYLSKTGGTLTGRLTINDASSAKPLILNTTYTGATSVHTEFQVGGTPVGTFEYGLDSAWLKLFVSDGKGNGYGITGLNGGNDESRYGKLVAVKNVGTGWATYEFWHAGNSGDYTYDWKCKTLYAAGHITPRTAETYAVGLISAPFAEVHANKWYPNKNDTAHYIEYVNGHWLIHGDAACTGDLAASYITA